MRRLWPVLIGAALAAACGKDSSPVAPSKTPETPSAASATPALAVVAPVLTISGIKPCEVGKTAGPWTLHVQDAGSADLQIVTRVTQSSAADCQPTGENASADGVTVTGPRTYAARGAGDTLFAFPSQIACGTRQLRVQVFAGDRLVSTPVDAVESAAKVCGLPTPTPDPQPNPQPTPNPAPTPNAPTHGGVRSDTITIGHEFIVGSPMPTNTASQLYATWPYRVLNQGRYDFALSEFPPSILPSGGDSNIISASEMFFVGIKFANPPTRAVTMTWHRVEPNQDVAFFSVSGSQTFYSYVGHFAWEVTHPGWYYVVVDTEWGALTIDFIVTGPPCPTTFC